MASQGDGPLESSSIIGVAEQPEAESTPHSLAKAVYARRSEYVRSNRIRVKIGTWNVAVCPGTDKDLATWFTSDADHGGKTLPAHLSEDAKDPSRAESRDLGQKASQEASGGEIDLYVLGLQEVVDLNATKEYLARAVYTDTSTIAKWEAAIEASLPPGYERVVAEQMVGLLLLVYASPKIAPTISNVSTKQVGTGGLMGTFGNKGAVTTRLVLGETTRMVFVNCHLASGAGASYLDRRCWDVGQILSKTEFDPIVLAGVDADELEKIGDEDLAFWFGDLNFRLDGLPGDDIRRLLTLHARGEYGSSPDQAKSGLGEQGVILMKSSDSDDEATLAPSFHSRDESFDSETTLPDPDDFPEDPSQDPTSLQATIESLLPHDQLRKMIKQRKAFHDGWREGSITFLPTYKYDMGTVGLFDTSEKQRAPSWCDRILFRTRKDRHDYETRIKEEEEARKKDDEMKSRGLEEDDDVLFSYDADADGEEAPRIDEYEYDEYDENEDSGAEDVVTKDGYHDSIELEMYDSHQRITSSDHKPISSLFTLDYEAVVPDLKAKVHAEVARELDRAENEGRPGITVVAEGGSNSDSNVVDFGEIFALAKKTSTLTVANTSGVPATFSFVEKPTTDEGDAARSEWLRTSFIRADETTGESLGQNVTLEPGETVSMLLEAQVTDLSRIRTLNEGLASIEEVLVLRIEDGRDHFISVRGTWQPTCLGRSIPELIRVPDGGIRKFVHDKGIAGSIPYDSEVHCSAPKELFKLTETIQTLVERSIADATMLDDATLPQDAGWPVDPATWTTNREDQQGHQAALVAALDTDESLVDALPVELAAFYKLEITMSVLLLFLESLTDGLIPANLWAKLSAALPKLSSVPPSAWEDAKTQVLDVLASAPNHNIAFVFLTATLTRVVAELTPATSESKGGAGGLARRLSVRLSRSNSDASKARKLREKRYAEVMATRVCRMGDGNSDKGAKDRARTMMEMFLRRDDV